MHSMRSALAKAPAAALSPPSSPRKMLTLLHFMSRNRAGFQAPPLPRAPGALRAAGCASDGERGGACQSHRQAPACKGKQAAWRDWWVARCLGTLTLFFCMSAQLRIHACFERIEQTHSVFEQGLRGTAEMVGKLHTEQQWLAATYYNYFNFSAMQIQWLYRGYLGRRIFYQSMAVKAALRIQRRHRLERLRRFRLMCRKVLRGMRGIRAKEEPSHKELFNRVNHNMMIETQWRKAMGIGDTESTLIHALYRKKSMRKRIGACFRQLYWINSIVRYWVALVPEKEPAAAAEGASVARASCDTLLALESSDAYATDVATLLVDADGEAVHPLDPFSARISATTRRGGPENAVKQRGGDNRHQQPKVVSSTYSRQRADLSRDELRKKQQVYTQRIHEENLKRETARALLLEKQREAARLAELERQRLDEEQRQLRMAHAQALREDLERRGLIAIKELQSKKDEEQRKEEDARLRLEYAQQKIAVQVLSDETQQILKRKQRYTSRR